MNIKLYEIKEEFEKLSTMQFPNRVTSDMHIQEVIGLIGLYLTTTMGLITRILGEDKLKENEKKLLTVDTEIDKMILKLKKEKTVNQIELDVVENYKKQIDKLVYIAQEYLKLKTTRTRKFVKNKTVV
jgi:Zn-dependent M32 family carboxypeptidase